MKRSEEFRRFVALVRELVEITLKHIRQIQWQPFSIELNSPEMWDIDYIQLSKLSATIDGDIWN